MNELTNEQLNEYYQNAANTYCGCLGHLKSHSNEQLCKKYVAELTSRGVKEIPDIFQASELGKYNGKGSY